MWALHNDGWVTKNFRSTKGDWEITKFGAKWNLRLNGKLVAQFDSLSDAKRYARGN